ncbi:MAG: fibronectin type III domain-containing protein [Lewinellaceae bacterium]|nr:fibronectin type III domain-containing protein [Lewinellaceae bacterium]
MFCLRICAMLAIWLAMAPAFLSAQITPTPSTAIQHFREQGGRFESVNLFYPVALRNAAVTGFAPKAQLLTLDPDYLDRAEAVNSPAISLRLPLNGTVLIVDLLEVPALTPDFLVTTSGTGGAAVPYTPGRHYRGAVRGDDQSFAAISFLEGQIMGLIANAEYGNLVLGRLESPENETEYILYADRDLTVKSAFSCTTLDHGAGETGQPAADNPAAAGGCVRVYFEADYELFQNKGSVQATVDYLSGAFNQVAALYANEQISTMLSEVYVWTTPDSYSTSSSSTALKQFRNLRTSFNGDLAHLVGIGGNNLGGVAYLDVLCSPGYAYAFSDINTSYATVPTFSWTVEVLTHEMGHNLGSPHTQSCTWPGGAIDNCFSPEGNCAPGPAPENGGTIMSYCHLTNYGINFNNGFGPLPGDKIRLEVSKASCLASACSGSGTCLPPSGLLASNITAGSAVISWNSAGNADGYNLQWRVSGNATWLTVPNVPNPYLLSGLPAASTIEVRLQSRCGGTTSDFSPVKGFTTSGTTGATCNAPANPSVKVLSSSSAVVTWSSVSGALGYQISIQKNSAGSWTAPATTTGTSYTLSNLDAGTTYTVRIATNCSAGNSTYAYRTFTTPDSGSSGGCGLPGNFVATDLTSNSAVLRWDAVPGAVFYQIRYKLASAYAYGSAIYVSSTSYNLNGLQANSKYHALIRAYCNTSASAYLTTQFATTASGGPGSVCTTPANFTVQNVSASTAVLRWNTVPAATGYDLQIRLPNSGYWLTFTNLSSTLIQLTNLQPNSIYQVKVRARCAGNDNFSPYTNPLDIHTLSDLDPGGAGLAFQSNGGAIIDLAKHRKEPIEVSIFPNPTDGLLTVAFPATAVEAFDLEVLDPSGRRLQYFPRTTGQNGQAQLDFQEMPPGVYFLRLSAADLPPVVRRVVRN